MAKAAPWVDTDAHARKRDLVELGIVLVDTEHADVADVVVAAGVHAAGDLSLIHI